LPDVLQLGDLPEASINLMPCISRQVPIDMANLPDSFSDIQSGDILKHQLVDKITAKTTLSSPTGLSFKPEA